MPASGSTRWKIALRQISTTSNLSRFASRRSVTNLSMAQKQIAPTTIILRAPIKAEIMREAPFHRLDRQASIEGQGACRPNCKVRRRGTKGTEKRGQRKKAAVPSGQEKRS